MPRYRTRFGELLPVSRILVDTHVWLWLQSDPERLQDTVRDLMEDRRVELLLSAASSWEIAIKHRIGKLPVPQDPATYVPDRMRRSGTPAAVGRARARPACV